ncbi:hypothetical protein ACFXPQ_11135 [Streptomyces lydicus]|uniref:hypothetical protein n=1 Tax=Streptomyces lydicus TaxID=47763 RepID=UPI0036B44264
MESCEHGFVVPTVTDISRRMRETSLDLCFDRRPPEFVHHERDQFDNSLCRSVQQRHEFRLKSASPVEVASQNQEGMIQFWLQLCDTVRAFCDSEHLVDAPTETFNSIRGIPMRHCIFHRLSFRFC